jgi:hypothetical protein
MWGLRIGVDWQYFPLSRNIRRPVFLSGVELLLARREAGASEKRLEDNYVITANKTPPDKLVWL